MKLSDLVDLTAAELGRKASEVNTRARSAREGGFLRSGGRGRGKGPEMQPGDVSAMLLAMVTPAEPTATAAGLREMTRIPRESSEWLVVDVTQPMKARVLDGAPLSAAFSGRTDMENPLAALSAVIEATAAGKIEYRELACVTDGDGMTIKIAYLERAPIDEMRDLYLAARDDASAAEKWGRGSEPTDWLATMNFVLREPQADRTERTTSLPCEIVARIIRQALAMEVPA